MQLLEPLTSDQLLLYPHKVSSHFAVLVGKIINAHLDTESSIAAIANFVTNKVQQM